jgi:hypothetical protein
MKKNAQEHRKGKGSVAGGHAGGPFQVRTVGSSGKDQADHTTLQKIRIAGAILFPLVVRFFVHHTHDNCPFGSTKQVSIVTS